MLRTFAMLPAAASALGLIVLLTPARAELPSIDDRDEFEQFKLANGRFYAAYEQPTSPQPTPSPTRPRGPAAPQPSPQSRSFGAARGPQSSAPSMIGDFFGGGGLVVSVDNRNPTIASDPSGGGGVGRLKIGENTSPLPRDRVFHNYSYFDNVPLQPGGVNVNRFVPGFEKTLWNGTMSVEMRLPFATTLDSDIVTLAGANDTDSLEFGNISLPIKALLFASDTLAVSAGLQIALPTADDTLVRNAAGLEIARIENESVHLMPFGGLLFTPNDSLFVQCFVQVDTGDGNPVYIRQAPAGELDDATLLYADLSIGYWLHRNDRGLTGVAPMLELHWNRSLEEASRLQQGTAIIEPLATSLDTMNLVIGGLFEFGERTTLTLGYATPVSGGIDQGFDGEVRVILNHRFGPQTRASRAQF